MVNAPKSGNLFAGVTPHSADEQIIALMSAPGVKIERIVSTGQATPASQWLEQAWTEWVVVICGAARLRFADEDKARTVMPGDWIEIAPHARHCVEWTASDQPTIWLAIHMGAGVN